jgi:hypothetical protein
MPAPEILGQLLVRVIELEATAAAVNNTVLLLAKSIDERRDAQEALAHVIAGQELVKPFSCGCSMRTAQCPRKRR